MRERSRGHHHWTSGVYGEAGRLATRTVQKMSSFSKVGMSCSCP